MECYALILLLLLKLMFFDLQKYNNKMTRTLSIIIYGQQHRFLFFFLLFNSKSNFFT